MLIYFVVVPILLGVFLYLVPGRSSVRGFALLAQLGLVVAAVYLFFHVGPYGYIEEPVGNFYSTLGVILRVDMLSTVFIMLSTFIFLVAAVYTFNETDSKFFWFLFFLWEASLLGVFLTGDFFNIFVLMEVSTIVVAILIMYNRHTRSLYDGMIYLMINVVIMQLFLFGAGYVYIKTGTLDLNMAAERFADVNPADLILPYALIMTFISLKAAQMPMYGWLPKAHGTPGSPSAVSAILSGLHIKSAIYLLLRFQDVFSPISSSQFFLILGVVTAVLGIILAVAQTDFKLVLAYSTVAQVGLIIAGLSMSTTGSYNYYGSMYHIINHAVFKAALFLSSGVVTYAYGTRDITKIKGLFKTMPVIATLMILAVMGIIGTPLFNGSISKYFLMADLDGALNLILILVNMGTIIVFVKFSTMFFGEKQKNVNYRIDFFRYAPIAVLSVVCFLGGIFGTQFIYLIFGESLKVDTAGYIQKSLIFFASVIGAILIYRFIIKENKFLEKVRGFEMGFREMCTAIGVFLMIMLIYVGFVAQI